MEKKRIKPGYQDSPAAFTPMAEEIFYSVVDRPDFPAQEALLIYQTLQDRLTAVPFCDYLKRYIYRAAGITQPFDTVPLCEYQNIIAESFTDRGVPVSFRPTSGRIRQVCKNWLTQQTVNREVVLLLGFGLNMQLQSVEELLTKGLQEAKLDPGNLREVLCGYCYVHGYGYYRFDDLYQKTMNSSYSGETAPAFHSFDAFRDDEALLAYCVFLKEKENPAGQEKAAKASFEQLYRQAQEATAGMLNGEGLTDQPTERSMEADGPAGSHGQSGRGKRELLRQHLISAHRWTPEEITPADIEQMLQTGVPVDRHGNLVPMKVSTLNRQFRGRRLTRQRLHELLAGETQITRYDLITISFYVYALQASSEEAKLQYYRQFMDQTNGILLRCGFGPLYAPNPYESFLLMCILSEDPLGTYTDVMELSYEEARE